MIARNVVAYQWHVALYQPPLELTRQPPLELTHRILYPMYTTLAHSSHHFSWRLNPHLQVEFGLNPTHRLVPCGVHVIKHHKQKVKAGEQRIGKVDVFGHAEGVIIRAIQRVGSRQHTAACMQRGVDARLGDGDRLLFHDFVHRYAIVVAHLVKLVNAHHAPVGKHHRPGFQLALSCVKRVDNGFSSFSTHGRFSSIHILSHKTEAM